MPYGGSFSVAEVIDSCGTFLGSFRALKVESRAGSSPSTPVRAVYCSWTSNGLLESFTMALDCRSSFEKESFLQQVDDSCGEAADGTSERINHHPPSRYVFIDDSYSPAREIVQLG